MVFTTEHHQVIADRLKGFFSAIPDISDMSYDDVSELEAQIVGAQLLTKNLMQFFYEDNPQFDWKEFVLRIDPYTTKQELDALEEIMLETLERKEPFTDEEMAALFQKASKKLESIDV